jgi:hypothetical protein
MPWQAPPVTCWSNALAIFAACLALAGIGLTVASYLDVRREMAKPPTYADVNRIRELIGEYLGGDKVWRAYLGIGLTAASVVVGAAGSVLGSLAD